MITDLVVPFVAIAGAELGDKTQLAVVCLSSKTSRRISLFLGILFAFAIVDGIAVAFGGIVSRIFPIEYIKIVSGLMFLGFGGYMLYSSFSKKDKEEACELKAPFASGFLLIFASEFGDKTQIASALFAAQYNPIVAYIGIVIALAFLSLIAIFAGNFITKKIPVKKISLAAAAVFIILGAACIGQVII